MKTDRMTVAIGRIVTREPFFASILLGMDIVEDPEVGTFATNGIQIRYAPSFLQELTDDELIGVLCHEVEHVARLHSWRRGDRDPNLFNQACDYSINAELLSDRFILPKNRLENAAFKDLAEEQIYAKLAGAIPPGQKPGQNQGQGKGQGQGSGQGQSQGQKPGQNQGQSQKPGQGQGSGQGQGQGSGQGQGQGSGNGQEQDPAGWGKVEDCPGTEAERKDAQSRKIVEILRAAQVAKSQGKLPASMASWVETIKHPKVSWQELLRNYLTAFARDDYSWTRANRRYLDTGFILPSLHNNRCGTIAVAIDTSGSIGQNEFDQFVGELKDILETMKPEKTIFVQCDADIGDGGYMVLESGETLPDKIQMVGGGGTSFVPVFDRLAEEGESPEVLVYLTDAYGTFPDAAPDYPVIWAVTSKQEVPFGDRIEVEVNQ